MTFISEKHKEIKLCAFLMLLAGAHLLSAATVERITVSVDALSDQILPDAASQRISQLVRTREGEALNDKVLEDDLKALMRSNSFRNVKVEREKLPNGNVALRFVVTPQPIIHSITFTGNTQLKTSSLSRALTVHVNKPLDEHQLAKSRLAVLKKYQDEGYFGTSVTISRTENKGDIDLSVDIQEAKRYKLKGVRFEGNTVFKEDTLQKIIVTRRPWWRYVFRFGNYYNAKQHDLDKDALLKHYHSRGYMDFQITDIREEVSEDGKWLTLVYQVKEGNPYRISQVSINGNKVFSSEELLSKTTLKAGDIYDASKETADTQAMKNAYDQKGYYDLRLYPNHTTDEANQEVAIDYSVKEGDVIHVRDIIISGTEYTQDEVVRRELAIYPDDLATHNAINRSKRRLANLNYFDSIEILPAVTDRPDLRDLRIELSEKGTGNLALGAGFSTEENMMGYIEFSEANVDINRLCHLQFPPKGAGQHFRARLQGGSSASNLTLAFTEPWFLDRRLKLELEGFISHHYRDEYDQRNIGVQGMLSWPIDVKIPFTAITEQWSMGVGIRAENIRISDLDHDEADYLAKSPAELAEWYKHSGTVPGHNIFDDKGSHWANRLIWSVTRDTRNAFLFPSQGSLSSLQAEFVTSALGSYETYGKLNLSVAKYIPIGSDMVFKSSARLGLITNEKAAIFDRYFAGGIVGLRGIKRRYGSPVDAFKDPLGGNTSLLGSIEIMKPVQDSFYLFAFVDAGNVWWDSFETSMNNLSMTAGVGIQFKILPLTVYYGMPIVRGYDHIGSSGRFEFNLGMNF